MTQFKWCKVHEMKLHQLRYWLQKIENIPRKTSIITTKWLPMTL